MGAEGEPGLDIFCARPRLCWGRKMLKTIICLTLSFYAILWLSGCSPISAYSKFQPSTIENQIPIDVSNRDFPEFDVAKIGCMLPSGVRIGAHYDGVTNRWQHSYRLEEIINETTEQGFFREAIINELVGAGYKAKTAGVVFKREKTEARFLIGGAIIGAELLTFGPKSENLSEGRCRVIREVYDRQREQVIFKKETLGYAKIERVNLYAFTRSLRNSFRNLLASPDLVNAIETEKGMVSPPNAAKDSSAIRFLKSKQKLEKLDVGELNRATISIKTPKGHGSGFIINPDGYAITNYHVIEGTEAVRVFLIGGKPMEAHVIRTKPDRDLALIKLTGSEYDYLYLGSLNKVKVGMDIYAIGSPISLGLAGSISKGIISGLRKVSDITLLQIDASINPGNSGGPLVNADGDVIGIVALKISIPGVEGLGFAISIDDAKRFLNLQEQEKSPSGLRTSRLLLGRLKDASKGSGPLAAQMIEYSIWRKMGCPLPFPG